VREAAARDEIAASRYDSYLKILRDPTPVIATRQ
jgi:hypothetical protein